MHAADETFVSLADLLSPPVAPAAAGDHAPAAAPHADAAPPITDLTELARDVRVFRAQLRDAFDSALDALLRECVYAVLGRDLQLAECDVAAIVARVAAAHPGAQPLRVRVAASDLARVANDPALPPCVADALLAPGDAVLELAAGSIDARLGVRLDALFAGVS